MVRGHGSEASHKVRGTGPRPVRSPATSKRSRSRPPSAPDPCQPVVHQPDARAELVRNQPRGLRGAKEHEAQPDDSRHLAVNGVLVGQPGNHVPAAEQRGTEGSASGGMRSRTADGRCRVGRERDSRWQGRCRRGGAESTAAVTVGGGPVQSAVAGCREPARGDADGPCARTEPRGNAPGRHSRMLSAQSTRIVATLPNQRAEPNGSSSRIR